MGNNILTSGGPFYALMLISLLLSCTPKKQLVSPDVGNEKRVSRAERVHIIGAVTQSQLYFTTFSGRAKSKVSINKDSYDVTANVRIERDKAIWISITALMGIEVGRVLITPDSVKIMNRLQAQYIRKPFDYIYKFTSRELDFSNLQDLLVGNVITQAIGRDVQVFTADAGSILRGQANDLLYLVQLDKNYRTVLTLMDEEGRNQRLEASYTSYSESAGQSFPNQVNISITADDLDLQSAMNYSRVAYNEALEMPFSIPSRYKEAQ
ncbi:DUF4292 domain-containing protein [Parapedobacter tibetensis]|uniref:DUF4292 domain-containing protein n=1 Tax=Parapedobacter tibetensis TaxID=2972951 RepID=UPI00214DC72E|nr:DUF4292 domain-containing protein [Parapedobacter tibetensis]